MMPALLFVVAAFVFTVWFLLVKIAKLKDELATEQMNHRACNILLNMTEDLVAQQDDWFQDVVNFHAKFGHPISAFPMPVNKQLEDLRQHLILEEYQELQHGIEQKDLVLIADACADLIYVIIGTAIVYGIDLRPVWKAVQSSNMAKIPYSEELAAKLRAEGKKVPIGKVLKPEGWTPPNIALIIGKQEPILGGTFRGNQYPVFDSKTLSDNEIGPKTGVIDENPIIFGGRDETTDKQPYNPPGNN